MNAKKPLHVVERIERVELELTKFNAKRSFTTEARRLEAAEIGECVLLRDRTDPHSMYDNRVKGFGSGDVARLEEMHRDRRQPCRDGVAVSSWGRRVSRERLYVRGLPRERLAIRAHSEAPRGRGSSWREGCLHGRGLRVGQPRQYGEGRLSDRVRQDVLGQVPLSAAASPSRPWGILFIRP